MPLPNETPRTAAALADALEQAGYTVKRPTAEEIAALLEWDAEEPDETPSDPYGGGVEFGRDYMAHVLVDRDSASCPQFGLRHIPDVPEGHPDCDGREVGIARTVSDLLRLMNSDMLTRPA